MINLILIASNGQGVGKSYLANDLVTKGIAKDRDSFAYYIKKLCFDLHKNLSYEQYSKQEFFQDKKDKKVLNNKTPREFFCDFSDLIQKYYTDQIWADIVHQVLTKNAEKEENYTVVIDDWRRHNESDYLINTNAYKILKVFLNKETSQKLQSKTASKFEGQIKPEDCDIVFTLKDDYSNYQEIIEGIKNHVT